MAERALARSLPRLMILTGEIALAPRLRPLLLMIMFEHGSRRTLLDDQQLPTSVLWNDASVRFGSAVRYRTHVASFVPSPTDFFLLRVPAPTYSPPNSPADPASETSRRFFYYGIALDLRHTICSAYPNNRTNVSVGRSGNSFRRNALQRWVFFHASLWRSIPTSLLIRTTRYRVSHLLCLMVLSHVLFVYRPVRDKICSSLPGVELGTPLASPRGLSANLIQPFFTY
ncbi:hypothetical protein CY34DRAFT_725571 [Suillus luteus UH-Slu-Lm8-n1]|uniref:Uncharacterized protein n=1 Tax=Suillus luteus UH-Slu-Lm8-n1 TaxID=930992 RepID=A0A0D0AMV2_9AGAM|nr:hypothetical protein CY34DRAFT_725571 [Suillus luteus UH-Slu-Lm8-n1]